ncbi:hypothetical protein D3C81_2318160 [compost metagenome]
MHNVPALHHFVSELGPAGGWVAGLVAQLGNIVVGVIAGAVMLAAVTAWQKFRGAPAAN